MSEREVPWEYREHALIVLPGIERDEWEVLWGAVDRMGRSVNFYIGDALLAGQREFGEMFSQVLDAKYIEQHRNAMWVCSKIPPLRRRPNLSWSLHREIASLKDDAEQDRWLRLADEGGWTVKQFLAARAAERPGSNGGPPLAESSLHVEQESRPPDAPQMANNAPPPRAGRGEKEPDVEALRRCIDAVRDAGKALARGENGASGLSRQIAGALGRFDLVPSPIYDTMAAIDLIPEDWLSSIHIDGGEKVFGGRRWIVEIRSGKTRLALGSGPWLPAAITEAALAATISELQHREC